MLLLAGVGCRAGTSAQLGAEAPRLATKSSEAKSQKRDSWQRPDQVLDALGIRAGNRVADVGAGEGYFTFHLAARVGDQGKVYAEDVAERGLETIRDRAKREPLPQIETILGTETDPRLPTGTLDVILVVNAYHEMEKNDAMLSAMVRALKPGGRLGVIDREAESGKPRSDYFKGHKIPKQLVLEDAARNRLRFVREEKGFDPPEEDSHFFFLVFERPT
jgi:predicted methyltransferase